MANHILNLDTFDVDSCFWKQNPQIKYITPFAELYTSDKSKDKVKSSKQMWAIFFINEPSDKNKFFRMNEGQRKEEVRKHYLKKDDFDFAELDKYADAYKELILTKKERSYLHIWKKWEEREEFIATLDYDIDTVELLDKLLANTEKLLASIVRAEEDMVKEDAAQGLVGKAKKSIIEGL